MSSLLNKTTGECISGTCVILEDYIMFHKWLAITMLLIGIVCFSFLIYYISQSHASVVPK